MLKGPIGNYHHLVLIGLVRVIECLLSFNPSFRFFMSTRNQINNIILSFLHESSTIYYMAYLLPQHRPINHSDIKLRNLYKRKVGRNLSTKYRRLMPISFELGKMEKKCSCERLENCWNIDAITPLTITQFLCENIVG